MSEDASGPGLAMKPTMYVTNVPLIVRNIERRCSNLFGTVIAHRHVQLMCGRAKDAAVWRSEFVQDISE